MSPVDELRELRPVLDPIARDDVRSRVERALFEAAEPARVGRFVLLGAVARGGMGVVYSAYDPQLDRRVALKLIVPEHRSTTRARELLFREARALARLAHPNVVPIHDVTVIDDQVVLVMELVAGRTLASWESAAPRSWQEIVAVYVAAGRGLAAAHELGLVHRDFKPANAIVGDDGRVRVLDFGLAHLVDAGSGAAEDGGDARVTVSSSMPASTSSAAGALAGTLGYMAPEQLAGGPVTARSDQFSFCVALHRALHGVAPFAGTTAAELLENIRRDRRIRPRDARSIPGWLHAAIERGLAADPAARHPSMRALLDVLDRERGWRRWRVPAVGALGIGAAVISALVASRRADPLAACDGGAAELSAIWSPARRESLGRHLAGLSPSSEVVAGEVTRALDRYGEGWSKAHRAGCVSHVRRTRSDSLHDRSMACLRRRKDAFAAAIDELAAADAASIRQARNVTAGLPTLAACTDDALLTADVEPPVSADERQRLGELRRDLALAEARERAGRSLEALDLARDVVARAEQLGYLPDLVDALLVEGRVLVARDDLAAAIPALHRAEELALSRRWISAAVIAAARRIYAEARSGAGTDALLSQAAVYELLSRELPGDTFARPLLLNNLGVVHMVRGDREGARREFAAARAARDAQSGEEPALELAYIDSNLAMVTADPVEREALARAAWLQFRDRLGAEHEATLQALMAYAHYVADPARSIELVRDACDLYRRHHADLIDQRADCGYYLGFLTAELGEDPTAPYLDIAALVDGAGADDDALVRRHLATGYARLQHGALTEARAAFAAALAAVPGDPGWPQKLSAHAHLGLGLVHAAAGRDRAAIGELESAIDILSRLGAVSADVEQPQRLALARTALARSLRRLGEVGDRAARLEGEAAAFFRATNPGLYRARLAALERHAPPPRSAPSR